VKDQIGGRSRWDVEQDLRSLRDVNKIQGDKKRMKSVGILVKEEMSALEKLADKDQCGLGTES